jgi:hypothetical protein
VGEVARLRRGHRAGSFFIFACAFCRTPEKVGSFAQICRQIAALVVSHMQLAADCSGLRKEELKIAY